MYSHSARLGLKVFSGLVTEVSLSIACVQSAAAGGRSDDAGIMETHEKPLWENILSALQQRWHAVETGY